MDQSYQQEPEEEMDAQADDPMLCGGGAARAKQTREEFEHRGDMDDLELLELLRPAKRHRGAVSGPHEDTGTSESME